MVRYYKVGGCVRDKLLGLHSKDIDYAVEASSWEEMRRDVHLKARKIFLEKPQFLTIRALWDHGPADFVLCRKEGAYSDARRPDEVEPGTLYDDLKRRDFTMNALAEDPSTGEIIDHFGGQDDIKMGTVRCVGSPKERFAEDGLRILRALRFAITKDFGIASDVQSALRDPEVLESLAGVSTERVREELTKMFRHSTRETFYMLMCYTGVREAIFIYNRHLWLEPTTKYKGS